MRKSDRPFHFHAWRLRLSEALPFSHSGGCYAWARPSKNRAMETAPASGVPMVLSP